MKELTVDQKKHLLISLIIFVALLPVIFVPVLYIKATAAALLAIAAVLVCVLIKKRNIHSFNKRQVLILLAVVAAVYLMFYYLTGLYFGFAKNYPLFSLKVLIQHLIPAAIIIIATEIIRTVLLSQKAPGTTAITYLIAIIADVLLGEGMSLIGEMHRFLDIFALHLLPAITSNLLYNYIAKRYGSAPNIAYRLILTLIPAIVPVLPAMSGAISSIFMIMLPLVVQLFIHSLYKKDFRYATKRKTAWSWLGMGAFAVVMISIVMLISCQFRFGIMVVATPSMSGAIEVGDTVFFEQHKDIDVKLDDVILFTRDGETTIIHRVVDIEKINGQLRYYTKGDANDDVDYGYITKDELIGLVHFKIPLIGHPTLWLRDLFK